MTDKKIEEYIDRLNNGKGLETIFLRKISEFVYISKVWDIEPILNNDRNIDSPFYIIFFIKDYTEKCVGAILDMGIDLHWFIKKGYRKKGHLTKALKTSILPYIFYDDFVERDTQRITINSNFIGVKNYNNSRRVTEKLGFKIVDKKETEFELTKEEFDWTNENLNEENAIITSERFIELRNRLILSYRQLIKISDELLMTCGDDKELSELAKKVSYYKMKIDDIEWNYKEK